MNKETQSTAQEILEKHLKILYEKNPGTYQYEEISESTEYKVLIEAMEEYANQKISAHQFKQSPSDAQKDQLEMWYDALELAYTETHLQCDKEESWNPASELLMKKYEIKPLSTHKEEPQEMKADIEKALAFYEYAKDSDLFYDWSVKRLSSDAGQGHPVKVNTIHCTCPYCSRDFDIQPALNTLVMRSHEMDAGQSSNVKEE
jgi:hypothetical protein